VGIDDCYILGNVIKTHGLNGEISILLDVDDPSEYKGLESVFVDISGKLVPFFIESIHLQKENKALVAFEDVEDLNAAREIVGCNLYLPLTNLPKLGNGKYYFHELLGFEVYNGDILLGHVINIYELPQNNLLAVDHQEKEVLIPLEDGIILTVDTENKKIITELPEGLLEVYKAQ